MRGHPGQLILTSLRTLSQLRLGKSVKSVSAKVGYNSPAAFTRVFTRKLGISPTEWITDASTHS